MPQEPRGPQDPRKRIFGSAQPQPGETATQAAQRQATFYHQQGIRALETGDENAKSSIANKLQQAGDPRAKMFQANTDTSAVDKAALGLGPGLVAPEGEAIGALAGKLLPMGVKLLGRMGLGKTAKVLEKEVGQLIGSRTKALGGGTGPQKALTGGKTNFRTGPVARAGKGENVRAKALPERASSTPAKSTPKVRATPKKSPVKAAPKKVAPKAASKTAKKTPPKTSPHTKGTRAHGDKPTPDKPFHSVEDTRSTMRAQMKRAQQKERRGSGKSRDADPDYTKKRYIREN